MSPARKGLCWLLGITLAALAAVGVAYPTPQVIPIIPFSAPFLPDDYWTSTTIPATSGGSVTFNQGGLCPVVSSGAAAHCGNVGTPSPVLDANGRIPLANIVPQHWVSYDLVIGISDVTTGYPYQVVLHDNTANTDTYLGIPAAGNGNHVSIILNDGLAPHSYSLGIVNDTFANHTPQETNLDAEFALSVTQTQTSPAVWPISQAMFGAVLLPEMVPAIGGRLALLGLILVGFRKRSRTR